MREPQSWFDKVLLEDEPFLSAFKARQIAGPPTRRCTGQDDDADDDARRNAIVAKEIEGRNLIKVVQTWVDHAFKPHYKEAMTRKVNAREPGILNLFVKFYWALSQDHKLATLVLDKERRRRGHKYALDIPTLRGGLLVSTAELSKRKKVHSKIISNMIDEKTEARPPQREDISDKGDYVSNGALCGQSLPKKVKAGNVSTSPKSNKSLYTKKDVPGYPEREKTGFLQNCPPSLDSSSESSKTQDLCQIQLNSSLLPLPLDSYNMAAVRRDLPKTRKRRHTSPDTRRVKDRQINGATSDSNDPNASITAQLANTSTKTDDQATNFRAGGNLKPLSQAPRFGWKEDMSMPSCSPLASTGSESTRFKFNKEAHAQGKQISRSALGKRPRHPKDANTELVHVSNSAINGQSLNKKTESRHRVDSSDKKIGPRRDLSSKLQRKREHLSQGCPPSMDPKSQPEVRGGSSKVDAKVDASEFLPRVKGRNKYANFRFSKLQTGIDGPPKGQGISAPRINTPVLQSSPDQCDTLMICDASSNSRKRPSSGLDALEGGNYTIVSKEVAVGRAEREITTGHRETKRRKIVQEETMAEPVKDERAAVLAYEQWKGTRTEGEGLLKVGSLDRLSQGEIHPATDLPLINESPSHQLKQDETTSNLRKRRASSSEVPQYKRQEVAVNQENSVLLTEMALSLSEQNAEIKQETSISTCIPISPPQPPDLFGSQETGEGRSRHDRILQSLDRNMREESINLPEILLLEQEHDLVQDFALGCVDPTAMLAQEEGLTLDRVAAIKNYLIDTFPPQKPPLGVNPPIWAQSRQEVCESFDWFRSYQGGVYFAHNTVKGYLLSAFSSKRDRFEHGGRLIISHGGGRAKSLHTRKGQTTTQPATDQLAQDKSVRALLDNYRNQRPLVLLIDDKYVLFPYDLGARDMTYVVLGFYTIVHAWAEYQPASNEAGHVVRYKFAFRWCDDQGSPWWLDKETYLPDLTLPSIPPPSTPPPSATLPSTPTTFSIHPTSKRTPTKKNKNGQVEMLRTTIVREATSFELKSFVCSLCYMGSPQVYAWSWLCLYPNCSRFWSDINGNVPPDNLEYDFGFLKLMASLPIPPDFGKLEPDLPSRLSTDGTVTSYAFTRGFHCKSCGRLSCRFKWEKWECMNCGRCFHVSGPVHQAKDFWSNLLPVSYKDHFIKKVSQIEQQPVRVFKYEHGMGSIQSFILPDGRGKIHHIQPGTPMGRHEADEIFIEYQQQATAGVLQFRRWPLRSHKCRGALLTNYFSQNSGEPYQYVGGAANTVPFENAPGAVVKARALIQKRIRQALEMHVEFNEVLSAAYMERQKMAFHSDSEIGLGPVVAGLSLGSPALMHFRLHVKYDPLREQKGTLLSFVLRHGDILVMDGARVQEYYEHTVVPNNFRIAATARQINLGHV